jgi:hypothetical protein
MENALGGDELRGTDAQRQVQIQIAAVSLEHGAKRRLPGTAF